MKKKDEDNWNQLLDIQNILEAIPISLEFAIYKG